MRLVEVDQPAQIQFKRCLIVLEVHSPERLIEFHRGHDEGSFEPGHIGCGFAEWLNTVIFSHGIELIPQLQSEVALDP